jgi:hypothetical protein
MNRLFGHDRGIEMIRRENSEEDRKRVEAYEALAHPVADPGERGMTESTSPMFVTHDGEDVDDTPPAEDILEGLDREGLEPRTQQQGAER